MCSADWWQGRPDDCCVVSVSTISTAAWAGKLKTGSRKLQTNWYHFTLNTADKMKRFLPKEKVSKWNKERSLFLWWAKGWTTRNPRPLATRISSPFRTASGPTKSPLQRVSRVGIKATEARSYLGPSSAEMKNVPARLYPNTTWPLNLPPNYVVKGMWRRIARNEDKWILFWMWCRVVLYTGIYVSEETAASFFKVKDFYKRSVHPYKSSMRDRSCFTRDKAARAWS